MTMDTRPPRIADFSPGVVEAWATFETLLSLGFSSDWISIRVAPALGAGVSLLVVLASPDGKLFVITLQENLSERAAQQMADEYARFAAQVRGGPWTDQELRNTLESSHAWKHIEDLGRAIERKGILRS